MSNEQWLKPIPPVDRTKLSDLMREGIRQNLKKLRWSYFDSEDEACALGCVLFAKYGCRDENRMEQLREEFPVLGEVYAHPDPYEKELEIEWTLEQVIVDLNDEKQWTRESIVLWLESEGL